MDELEIVDGVVDAFADGAAAAGDMASVGAEVADDAGVADMAEAPPIEDATPSTLSKVQDFINNNPYGKVLWTVAKTTASASAAFGIIYGLNKAAASKAQSSGTRTALSEYLEGVRANYAKLGIPWTDDVKASVATGALNFPWIDSTL